MFSNRFVMFNKYAIPKKGLLGKTGDINDNGEYISPFKDKSKRLGKIFVIIHNLYNNLWSSNINI